MPYPDYVANCVAALEQKRGDNVGGVWEIKPSCDTKLAACIALAAAHPLGVGDAHYRLGKQAGAVDTVPFGAFRRSLFDQIGGLNEEPSNQRRLRVQYTHTAERWGGLA